MMLGAILLIFLVILALIVPIKTAFPGTCIDTTTLSSRYSIILGQKSAYDRAIKGMELGPTMGACAQDNTTQIKLYIL
jgi:hypothetical protein